MAEQWELRWQPMKTGPRDGSTVLLRLLARPGSAAALDAGRPEGFVCVAEGRWWPGAECWDLDDEEELEITHWMPSPAFLEPDNV